MSADFSRFERRLIVRGTLTVETGLRIATGRGDEISGADIAVMKDALRRPFVPGSSFKGALRTCVERLVRALWQGPPEKGACDPLDNQRRCVNADMMNQWRQDRSANGAKTLADKVLAESCRVCRVFGSPWLASRAAVRDLTLKQPEFWTERRYEVRVGVGIERDSEAAQEGVLYSSQLVPPGTAFDWEIVIDNADAAEEEPLVFLGLREMMRGAIPLGGGRSRGLGRIHLGEISGEVVTADTLPEYLATGKGRALAWAELESGIPGCLSALRAAR